MAPSVKNELLTPLCVVEMFELVLYSFKTSAACRLVVPWLAANARVALGSHCAPRRCAVVPMTPARGLPRRAVWAAPASRRRVRRRRHRRHRRADSHGRRDDGGGGGATSKTPPPSSRRGRASQSGIWRAGESGRVASSSLLYALEASSLQMTELD